MKCLTRKKTPLAIRLPSYKPLNILIRFIAISLIAIVVIHLVSLIISPDGKYDEEIPFNIYFITILAFNVAAELQIILDNVLERIFPTPYKIKLRIFLKLFVGIAFLLFCHRMLMYFIDPKLVDQNTKPEVIMGMLMGLLFVQIIATSLTVARFTQKLLDSQEQIAQMKREKLQIDYQSLQDQLNPHFLFNNLSVLKSLIIYDKEAAIDFTENFTDVYRYVLQSKEKRLAKLSDELEFMKAYYALHKERLGDGLQIEIAIDKKQTDKEIPPLTVQLLIENAIKHNITSRETPLTIRIETTDDYFIVSNTLNLKTSSYSTKTGLKNLIKRYEMLTSNEIIIQHNSEYFEVKVPLL